jgi:hypothetical protein
MSARCKTFPLTALVALMSMIAQMNGAEEYWLFAGQSNMSPKAQSRNAFATLPSGIKRHVLAAQHDGKPFPSG